MTIKLPPLTPDIIPCQHAWVLSLSNILNFSEEKLAANDGEDDDGGVQSSTTSNFGDDIIITESSNII